jgi:hypothetical protein
MQKIRSITISLIPAIQQRYETLGDWLFDGFGNLHIKVTDTGHEDVDLSVAIHELVEAILCRKAGISQDIVDIFDFSNQELEEPGDSLNAPYHYQHKVASHIEEEVLSYFQS